MEIAKQLDSDQIDEMGIPSYLDGNWLSRKAAWGKLRVVVALADFKPNDVLLDFGCGTGILLALTKGSVKRVYASDIEPRFAQLVVQQLDIPHVTFHSPDELATLPQREVTKVLAANVLEHVPDVVALVNVFASIMARNGKLIVSGPTENVMYRLGRRIVGFSGDYHVRTVNDIFGDIVSSGRFSLESRRAFPFPGPMCLYRIASFVPR